MRPSNTYEYRQVCIILNDIVTPIQGQISMLLINDISQPNIINRDQGSDFNQIEQYIALNAFSFDKFQALG